MNRQHFLHFALAAALFIGACGPQAASDAKGPSVGIGQATQRASATTPVKGGTLTLGMSRDATNFDPLRQSDVYSAAILNNVVDTLFEVDASGNVVGRLVEKSDNPQPNVYKWMLRKGITFQDGTPLNSEAVKFNLERHMNDPKSTRRQDVKDITGIETPDENTVVVTLKGPHAPFLNKLTGGAGYIVSPTAVQKLGDNLQRDLTGAGSGPFTFASWQKDTQIVLQRNPTYWKKDASGVQLPYLDKLVFKVFPDENTRLANLKAGEIDALAGNPGYKDAQDMATSPDLSVKQIPGAGITIIALNTQKEPFNDPAVRRAFSLAIDRDAIQKTVFSGEGRPLDTVVPETVAWAYDKNNHPYAKRDVAKAKQELASAGKAGGVSFTFQTSNASPEIQSAAELIKDEAREAGINMDIQLVDFATLVANGTAGSYDALAIGLTGDLDPDGTTYSLLYTGAGQNLAHYSNPKLDSLLDAGRNNVDQTARATTYKQIQQLVLDEQPVITIWNAPQISATRKNVHDYPQTYNGYAGTRDFDKIWKSA